MAPTGRSKNASRLNSSRLFRFRARRCRRTVASEVLNSSARSMFVLRSRSGSASLAMIASSSGLTGLQSWDCWDAEVSLALSPAFSTNRRPD
nr:MAG TPA: hypothetical protein [Caudoviricetes sp.]